MTDDGAVLTEARDRVLVITLNRPDVMNAIDGDMASALLAAVTRLDGDDHLAVGVLAANGRGFCAGMDLKAFTKSGVPADLQRFVAEGSVKPLVCAVEGFALAGGLELALTCDLIVASRGAKLGIPEVGVGLFAAGGGLLRLPSRLPYGVAMQLALTGDPVTAEEAHAFGLVSSVVERGEARAAAVTLAERIARNAPLAVVASKAMVRAVTGRTETEFWDLQREHFERVFNSNDGREGPLAFTQKRDPQWTRS